MAKEKKVCVQDTPKYTSSSDEESSDDEVDYTDLFKGLDRTKVDKINELIDALNEKYRLLEKQEDILYEEHDKFISVQKSLALEIKRNEMLSSELSTCHESISGLKNLNDDLNAKLEKINATSSCVEHVVICNRCKDVDFDEHVATIAKLNNDVASLNDQLKTCKNDYEKLKFARDAYTVGRHPSIKDGLGFRKETKNLTSQRTSDLNKGKGKAPMASSSYSSHDQKNHAYLYTHAKEVSHHDRSYDHVVLPIYHNSHAMVASSFTHAYGRNRPRRNHVVSHAPRKVAMVLLLFIMPAILCLCFHVKMPKYLLENWDLNARETRLAFGFQKLL
jgi:DNA repair exonuclease SbcCD ATPase subunit